MGRSNSHWRMPGLVLLLLGLMPHGVVAQEPAGELTRIGAPGLGLRLDDPAVSRDGRWIAFSRGEAPNRSSIWLMPASGGDMVRLTDDGYADHNPSWSRSGDRIYFESTRPSRGEGEYFVMSLPIDPRIGRAVGAPRQVTIERNSGRAAPSPDGRMVAYRVGRELRVVPANGGNSQLLAMLPALPFHLAWEPDGSALYFVMFSSGWALYSVSPRGGEPESVLRIAGKRISAVSPEHRLVGLARNGPGNRERTIEVADWTGRILSRNVVDRSLFLRAFSSDGRSLVALSTDVGAIIRARPTSGGEARDLTDGSIYDWPVAWTADSRAVIAQSIDSGMVARILPIDGRPERSIPVPAEDAGALWDWGTPTFVSYVVPRGDDDFRLVALDVRTGETTVLSERMRRGGGTGPGGLYRDTDGVFFRQIREGRVDYMSARPGAEPRVIHSMAESVAARTNFAFHGDRVAFLRVIGDSVGLMVKTGRNTEPRLIGMVDSGADAAAGCCRTSIAFSHDGEWLVLAPITSDEAGEAVLVRVPASGRASEIRTLSIGAEYWYEPRWLPDNSGFTVTAGRGADAWVTFVPIAPGASPRPLTEDEDGPAWGHELSPDGRWIAYPAEVWRGSSLWRLELPAN